MLLSSVLSLSLASAIVPADMALVPEGDFWMGLAVTVVGGLLASTLLAPLASVALLTLIKRWR